jgi:hypothetical protein
MRERPKNALNWNAHRDALVKKYSANDKWYTEYLDAVTANELTKAKTLRDQTLYDLIWLFNDRYTGFENSLNSDSATLDTATTVTSLASTTAATITRAAGTKSILAAVSTVVTGTDTAFNSNFFQSKARTAIIAAMRSGRYEVLTKITTGISQPVDKYSLGQGLSDVLDYNEAGTVVSAVNTIEDNAKQQKDKAQDKANLAFHIQ